MDLVDEQTKSKILSAIREEHRLIGDVATDYGVSRKQIFNWLKKAERIDKRTKALKESGLKRRIDKLSKELASLNVDT